MNAKNEQLALFSTETKAEYVRLVTAIGAGAADDKAPLTPTERMRMTKPREFAPMFLPQVAALAREFGFASFGGRSVDQMLASHHRATQLAELSVHLDTLSANVEDAKLRAQDDAWKTALAFYSVLQSLAAMDANLAGRLAPVQAFFQPAPRRAKQATEPVVEEATNG